MSYAFYVVLYARPNTQATYENINNLEERECALGIGRVEGT